SVTSGAKSNPKATPTRSSPTSRPTSFRVAHICRAPAAGAASVAAYPAAKRLLAYVGDRHRSLLSSLRCSRARPAHIVKCGCGDKEAPMKKNLSTLSLTACLAIAAPTLTHAQSAPARPTFVDSDIRLVVDYPPIATKAFTSAPVLPLHKG